LIERLEELLRNQDIQVNLNTIQQQLQEQILAGYSTATTYTLMNSQIFFANFVTLVLIAAVTFFMLLDGQRLRYLSLSFYPKIYEIAFLVLLNVNF